MTENQASKNFENANLFILENGELDLKIKSLEENLDRTSKLLNDVRQISTCENTSFNEYENELRAPSFNNVYLINPNCKIHGMQFKASETMKTPKSEQYCVVKASEIIELRMQDEKTSESFLQQLLDLELNGSQEMEKLFQKTHEQRKFVYEESY